jgi:NADP-dependent 3-hydroxy acid dehydrogenase YdfG
MNNIEGKIVVITGASSGLGEATARHLAKLGAKVVLGARRVALLEKLVAEITAVGGQAVAVGVDVTIRADSEKLLKVALENFGRVDVWISWSDGVSAFE